MCKGFLSLVFVVGIGLGPTSLFAADSVPGTPPSRMPLTVDLLKEIHKSQYVNEAVQTTNGNAVGLYADVINDTQGKPALFVLQIYTNVTRTNEFAAVPWDMMRFDPQNRRIEIAATVDYLRKAPKFNRVRLDALKSDPEELAKLSQSMDSAMGGGAVAATMGTQSGQGSSLHPPATNDAQPQRGSVGMIYVLGIVAAALVGFAIFARRRV